MDAEKVPIRSVKQDTETILSIFHSRKDRPGDVIRHSELLAALGVAAKDKWYGVAVNRARRLLFDQSGIRLATVWGSGYAIPSGFDQMKSGVHTMKRAQSAFDNGINTIAHIVRERLSEREFEVQASILGKARYLSEMVRTKRLGLESELGGYEPHPRMG